MLILPKQEKVINFVDSFLVILRACVSGSQSSSEPWLSFLNLVGGASFSKACEFLMKNGIYCEVLHARDKSSSGPLVS